MASISSTHTPSTDYIELAQAITNDLWVINDKIQGHLSQPSLEQFAPLYQSFSKVAEIAKALKKKELLISEPAFSEAMKNVEAVGDTVDQNCESIYDKLLAIIYNDSLSLQSNTALEGLSKKCEDLFQRIQAFKTMQPKAENNSTIKFALRIIEQIKHPTSAFSSSSFSSSALINLNQPSFPSVEQSIEALRGITKEILELNETLNSSEINTSDFNYFAPIGIAFRNAVDLGNNFINIKSSNYELIQVKKACLAIFASTKKIMNDCIEQFVKKFSNQAHLFTTDKTQMTQQRLEKFYSLKNDILTLQKIRPKLINNKSIIEATENLRKFQKELSIPDQQEAFGSSASSSSSFSSRSSLSSTSSSSLFNLGLNQDIFTPPDHKYNATPSAKRPALFDPLEGGQILPSQLTIKIPDDGEKIELPLTKAPLPEQSGDQNKRARVEYNSDLQKVIEQSEQDDPNLQRAIQLSIEEFLK